MANDSLIIISDNVIKAQIISERLKGDFNIIVAPIAETEKVLNDNPKVINVIYDLMDETVQAFRNFLVIGLRYVQLRVLILVSKAYSKELGTFDRDSSFWCLDCLTINEFHDRVLDFKQKRFYEEARVNLLKVVFNNSPLGFAVIPRNDIHSGFFNDSFVDIMGYTREEYMEIGWNGLTYWEDKYLDEEARISVEENGEPNFTIEKRIVRKDGSIVWVDQYTEIIQRRAKDEYIRVVMIRNINERKVRELELNEINRSRATIINNLPGLAYRCLNDGFYTMEFVSDGAKELTGYLSDELIGNKIIAYNDIIARKYRKPLRDKINKATIDHDIFQAEYEIITKNGQTKWVYERAIPIYDQKDNVLAIEGIILDISLAKKLEKQLQYVNDFNQKLRLPNREFLKKKIQARLDVKSSGGTIILINLKETQKLYRTHGYEYVQLLTASLVNKLRNLENDVRHLYYAEDDMYVFFAKRRYTTEQIKKCYVDIREAISNTIFREQIQCNIGIAVLDKTSVYAEDFLQKARIASEFVRDQNKLLSIYVYDAGMDQKVKREDRLKQELIETSYSDAEKKLRLVFQPLIELSTGKTTGFEALARYESDYFGPVSPVEFIPIVEKNRIAVAFGKKVIDLAINFIKKLLENGINNIPVSVNISTLQLLDSTFVSDLIGRLKAAEVPNDLFVVEVTETIFSANYTLLNERLNDLIAAGIRTALDDFGTGFSSLSRIEELQFNTLKIDKTFIQKLTPENVNHSTIPDIINMCKKFNLSPLAEGIETIEQYNLLKDLGCRYGQGYYMSRPLEVKDALKFILDPFHFN